MIELSVTETSVSDFVHLTLVESLPAPAPGAPCPVGRVATVLAAYTALGLTEAHLRVWAKFRELEAP